MAENKSSISQATTYEEIGTFWDEHDFTEFDVPSRPDVSFEIRDTIRIESELLVAIEKVAAARGVSAETLVNLWLQEKVQQALAPTAV